MVTGSSTSNLSIILVDARHGVVEQTSRHTFISSLLGIPHVVFCINKMDLVDYSEEVFENIKKDLEAFSSKLNVKDIHFVPLSALKGDNVVNKSENMDWYQGSTLMYLLENIHIGSDYNHIDCRFPVQNVIRPQSTEYHDYRGYAGRIAGGIFKPGDDVMVLPSGFTSKIKSIDTMNGSVEEAFAPMSVALTLEDDIDISRGDMIVRENNKSEVSQDIDLMVCWLNEKAIVPNGKYAVKHTSNDVRCIVKEVKYKVNINTLHRIEDDKDVKMNEIARISIRTTKPLMFDKYSRNRTTGSLILIDEATNETVGAGMIID
jgi:sulfate adenylyltransferase subunit 1